MMCSSAGLLDRIEFLLEQGANPNLQNAFGETAKDLARNKEILQRFEAILTPNKND